MLEADGDGDGVYESMMGDAVPPGSALRVRVDGAPGAQLRLVGTGGTDLAPPVTVTGPTFEHTFTADDDVTWVRAEIGIPDLAAERALLCDAPLGAQTTYCRNRLLVLAMTSALYLPEELS